MPPPARDPDDTVYLTRRADDDAIPDGLVCDSCRRRPCICPWARRRHGDDRPPAAPLLAVLVASAAGIIGLASWGIAWLVFALA